VNTILLIRHLLKVSNINNKKVIVEEVDLIKAREVEQGFYGTKD
jgi:hypothetical protein